MAYIDVEKLKQEIDCRKLAEELFRRKADHSSREYLQFSCPFHKDGRTPSLTVYRNHYVCFACGAKGDQIRLVQEIEGLDFKGACEYMANMKGTTVLTQDYRAASNRSTSKSEGWQSDSWRRRAQKIMEEAEALLPGSPGAKYLTDRGILRTTYRAFRLGYEPDVKQWTKKDGTWVADKGLGPAIDIPLLENEQILGIKRRLLEHGELRYVQLAGGKSDVFGLHLLRQRPILGIFEGEFNAMSAWQVAESTMDAVSIGSQSNMPSVLPRLCDLARRYRQIMVWVDDADRASALSQAFGGNVLTVRSVQGPTGKLDANELLRIGQLTACFNHVLTPIRFAFLQSCDPPLAAFSTWHELDGAAEKAQEALLEVYRRFGLSLIDPSTRTDERVAEFVRECDGLDNLCGFVMGLSELQPSADQISDSEGVPSNE